MKALCRVLYRWTHAVDRPSHLMPSESGGHDTGAEPNHEGRDTAGAEYAERLRRLDTSWWRRTLNVQAPYRWNIRRLHLGRVLDVGSGLGRNLAHLGNNGVGVWPKTQGLPR